MFKQLKKPTFIATNNITITLNTVTMRKAALLAGALLCMCSVHIQAKPQQKHNLHFKAIPTRWDEALPVGNGMLGSLVWQKGDNLRLSLDRADLWDLRPVKELDSLNFKMVVDAVKAGSYSRIQQLGDVPYDRDPAPSKIPGAALTFNITSLGEVGSADLDIATATAHVSWKSGVRFSSFVHAKANVGWFKFENLKGDIIPTVVPPQYGANSNKAASNQVVEGSNLSRLGYKQGTITKGDGWQTYIQEGWGGMKYQVSVRWHRKGSTLEGTWSITSHYPNIPDAKQNAEQLTQQALTAGFDKQAQSHRSWWSSYWAQSAISIPDTLVEKQWYMEQYKFGSASRRNAPPITLQAVWTADNGNLPPWKGDYHNDLNTQLSYWMAYSGNHLDEGMCFIDWLWKCRPAFKSYTKRYFGVDGLNAPGVNTLAGAPMGGWIQYSLGPTVGAWLAHHFYLQWRYSMDKDFLKQKAYPWIQDVAIFFDQLSVKENGKRRLPLSSSPEYNDNDITAWFKHPTNFDLALIKWTYKAAEEMALALGNTADAQRWKTIGSEWPDFATDANGTLLIAPNEPVHGSHRHFSHMLGIHPLGVIDPTQSQQEKRMVDATLAQIGQLGTRAWCGYSFSWMGGFYAYNHQGNEAADMLRKFASNFCSTNSFHLNGDQKGGQYSDFTYRPFTLEGNFAFASSLQEMMLQSHRGYIELFPALPAAWKDCRFEKLRAQGAFLVSAQQKDGALQSVTITSEKGTTLKLMNPFAGSFMLNGKTVKAAKGEIIILPTKPNMKLVLTAR